MAPRASSIDAAHLDGCAKASRSNTTRFITRLAIVVGGVAAGIAFGTAAASADDGGPSGAPVGGIVQEAPVQAVTATTPSDVAKPVADATKPVEHTTRAVTKPVAHTTRAVTKPVSHTTRAVTKPVEHTTRTVTKPVSHTTKAVAKPAAGLTKVVATNANPVTGKAIEPVVDTVRGTADAAIASGASALAPVTTQAIDPVLTIASQEVGTTLEPGLTGSDGQQSCAPLAALPGMAVPAATVFTDTVMVHAGHPAVTYAQPRASGSFGGVLPLSLGSVAESGLSGASTPPASPDDPAVPAPAGGPSGAPSSVSSGGGPAAGQVATVDLASFMDIGRFVGRLVSDSTVPGDVAGVVDVWPG